MGKKVIAAGHICLDITPVVPNKRAGRPEEILLPGKLLNVEAADVHTGGSVANTGLAMKILGADVTLMGKIGNDAFGSMILNILEQYQAGEGMIIDDKESTSYSVILALPGIDRIFLHHPGANHTFGAGDIAEEKLQEAALFHFGYPPLMKRMYEKEGEELVNLLQKVKAAGVATSLDMAAVDAESEAGNVNWKRLLEKILPYVDFFVPSVEELCFMLDKDRLNEWQERAGGQDITTILDVEKDIRPLADMCMDMGAKVLLIKCGAPGMYYRTADEKMLQQVGEKAGLDVKLWKEREGFEESYVPERVLSGTGAGDTSIAAFLTAMLQGYAPEKAVQLAVATGASCVEAYDALSGLRSLEELERKIADGWKKQSKVER